MKRKGVTYDVGMVMGGNWRPDYDPKVVHRELQIIKNDLHCNAVRITGRDLKRVTVSAEDALKQGLEVWYSPQLWNKTPDKTLAYTIKAATMAEELFNEYPDQVVFVVSGELTIFMQGIMEGKTFMKRLKNMRSGNTIKEGLHNKPLNDYLARACEAVRKVYHGPITYASFIWERVDWNLFDIVGVDHYWSVRIKDRYLDMLKPLASCGKPIVITEFGFSTTKPEPVSGALAIGNIEGGSFVLHRLPLLGRFIRVRLSRIDERDEDMQARRLIDQLTLLDSAKVDGAFISTFIYSVRPHDDEPRYDLDRESPSLVKTLPKGKQGTTYPDMTWEPKASFKAVADYYAEH